MDSNLVIIFFVSLLCILAIIIGIIVLKYERKNEKDKELWYKMCDYRVAISVLKYEGEVIGSWSNSEDFDNVLFYVKEFQEIKQINFYGE